MLKYGMVNLLVTTLMLSVSPSNEPPHRFIGSAYGSNSIFIVNRDGAIEWQHEAVNVQDVWMLKNGNILFHDRTRAMIVDRDHNTLMQYQTQPEVHSVMPLPNGNILVTLCGQSKVVEINPRGSVVKQIEVQSNNQDTHLELRDSVLTHEGTYLVALCKEGLVHEYDEAGKLIRVIDKSIGEDLGSPSDLQRLTNGNTLLATGYGRSVLEIDRNDKVVWSLKTDEIEGVQFGYVAGAVRLANGNTLVSLYQGTYLFFEVTPDKKITWSLATIPGVKGATSIQYLD